MSSKRPLAVEASTSVKRTKQEEERPKITPEEFYRLEDELSRGRSHSEMREAFLRESAVVKKALMDMMEGGKEVLDPSLMLNVARMRRLSRLSQYSMAQLKKQNAVLLEQAEAKYLELKNVNSEIQHLQKEIGRCLQFSSGDEDIELVPEEEFFAAAPDSISQPELTKVDEHAKHLARLNWELTERKQLVGTLCEQEGRRAVLISDINGKEQRLKSLRPKIDALIKAAKPVQDVLGVKLACTSSAQQRSLFSLLPHQLSVLYVQAEAYKDIVDDSTMSVSIVGSAEAAHQWMAKQDGRTGDSDEDEDDESAATKEAGDTDGRCSKKAGAVSSRLAANKKGLTEPHPIHLHIDVGCEDDVTVSLTLRYLPALRCTVLKYGVSGKLPECGSVCSENTLFEQLFDKDNGSSCPDPVGEAKLQHLKMSVESFASELGRPYRFVQTLTGDNTETDVKKRSGVQLADALQNVIETIRRRVGARIALTEHIKSLESLKSSVLTPVVMSDDMSNNISTELVSFKSITEEQYLSASTIPSSLSGDVISSGFHFEATLENPSTGLRTIAIICVPADYPSTTPVFSVSLSEKETDSEEGNSDKSASKEKAAKDLENHANVACLEDVSVDANAVLAHQLFQLAARSDVMIWERSL